MKHIGVVFPVMEADIHLRALGFRIFRQAIGNKERRILGRLAQQAIRLRRNHFPFRIRVHCFTLVVRNIRSRLVRLQPDRERTYIHIHADIGAFLALAVAIIEPPPYISSIGLTVIEFHRPIRDTGIRRSIVRFRKIIVSDERGRARIVHAVWRIALHNISGDKDTIDFT